MDVKVSSLAKQPLDMTLGEKEVPVRTEENKKAFLGELHKARQEKNNQELNVFLKRFDELAKALSVNRTVENLRRYKDAVKKFLAKTVADNFQLREDFGWDRRGRQKLLVTVQKTDEKLEEMTKLVMEDQASSIDILGKSDEIRGLLVDIYT